MPAIATLRHAPGPATSTPRFPAFDGLRALAALSVLAFHAATYTGLIWRADGRTSELGRWVEQLDVGVAIFFVLSGFLLFRPFVVAHLADRPPAPTRSFLARRLVRIFPAFWLALAVAQHEFDLDLGGWWGTVRTYGLVQVYWADTQVGGLAQAWTLCVELTYYLVLPLWAAAMARIGGPVAARVRAQLLGCGAWWVSGLVGRAVIRSGDHTVGTNTIVANTDLFALGMALAVLSAAAARGRPLGALARTLGEQPVAAWAAAAACFAGAVSLGSPFATPLPVGAHVLRQVLHGLTAVLLVAPAVFGPQDEGVVRRILRWRPLAALGVVSYGIYLWHITVLAELHGPDPVARPQLLGSLGLPWPEGVVGPTAWWTLTAWGILGSAVLAAISWFAVERPLITVVRRATGGVGRGPGRTSVAS